MIISPIIPIWIMGIICIILLILKRKDKYGFIRQIAIVILIFVINLRIMVPSSNVEVLANNLDILFVIDNTISMVAEDYNGKETRLSAVKKDCEYIINKFTGANFSVITFNNDSQVLVPYTKDANITLDSIESINVMTELYSRGSTLNIVKDDMLGALERSSKKNGRKRIVFFISDGEITNEEKLKSFSDLQKYVDGGAVLGYGTKSGGQMKVKYSMLDEDDEEYIQDKSDYPYKNAVSKIDEDNLNKLASDLGIDYINMSKQSNIDSKLKDIKQGVVTNSSNSNMALKTDIYYILAIPLSVLLIFEFVNYRKKL